MACVPCQQARAAALASFKAVAAGNLKTAASEAVRTFDALSDKAEALRIRNLTRRK